MAKGPSKQVYGRIHHLQRDIGNVRDKPGECAYAQSNASALERFIPKSQLRTTDRYEWDEKKGKSVIHHDPVDVIENAQRHMSRLKLSNPATSGERQRYREAECEARAKASGKNKSQLGGCVPMCCDGDWGKPGSPSTAAPLSGGLKRKY
jgi:hypothetical protein